MSNDWRASHSEPSEPDFGAQTFAHATLLYVSDVTDPACDLELLTRRAADWNGRHRITGLLCFDGRNFLQYVEGPEAAVHALLANLRVDKRHADLETLVLSRSNGVLRFPTWDMAYVACPDRSITVASLRGSRSAAALQAFEALLLLVTSTRYARP